MNNLFNMLSAHGVDMFVYHVEENPNVMMVEFKKGIVGMNVLIDLKSPCLMDVDDILMTDLKRFVRTVSDDRACIRENNI